MKGTQKRRFRESLLVLIEIQKKGHPEVPHPTPASRVADERPLSQPFAGPGFRQAKSSASTSATASPAAYDRRR